jgi:hypothetical protein
MQNKIVELNLNETEAVTGGATYATLSSSTTLQSSYTTTTYVKPTYTSTSLSSSSLLTATAPKLI